ncbi:iron-sulfur cluster repair di-iron protein [Shewanella cyperi]|uniref:iron-sulfur cluster repair di-iron protein n=1 Tax=Shewanella cyperi TaxID=2814292 RepID=UPI001A93BFDE|nr:iron-sulfur cluster repair di-iron protein [Shewanella cyperi]QSX40538.1 iron-sulfur cluster repair di-iron protein [Shewanella cyperi]
MNPTSLLDRSVGELVAEDFRRAHVFSQFGIDFCCGGGRSLAKACERAGVPTDRLLDLLETMAASGKADDTLNQLPLGELIDYIEANHHAYVREKAPLLLEYTAKMVRAHGEHFAEIKPLAAWVQALMDDLVPHLMKEEQVLFPAIRAMAAGEAVEGCFGHIGNPIRAMQHEHDDAGQILAKLREITGNYQPPENACTTWRVCYATLAEFEADLHRHIHLENNLLFPKVMALTC